MTNSILKILFIILFSGCAAIGTNTIFESPETFQARKIGYIDLDNESLLSKIYPGTAQVFRATVVSTFKEYGIDSVLFVQDIFTRMLNYSEPDTSSIKILCMQNNLDALLLTKLKFIYTDNSVMLIPVGRSHDTEVEMKLFDKNAKLIMQVSHNTKSGNSYAMPPSSSTTIHDGTAGALKRIAKKIRPSSS